MPSEADIQARVAAVIDSHGGDLAVRKYVSETQDRYKQGVVTFGTPVICRGRAITRPTREQLSFIGDGQEVEVAFLFSRLELVAKFPALGEGVWLTTKDEVGWGGQWWRLVSAHPTGRVSTQCSMLVMIGETAPGANRAYP